MMPFFNPTLATEMQKTYFNYSNGGMLEFPSEEKEQLSVKNAQVDALPSPLVNSN
jgi:hypothetical protein